MQILLVEDDNTLFQELKKELEQWDFNVVGVWNLVQMIICKNHFIQTS